jgi:hypothetical protein
LTKLIHPYKKSREYGHAHEGAKDAETDYAWKILNKVPPSQSIASCEDDRGQDEVEEVEFAESY